MGVAGVTVCAVDDKETVPAAFKMAGLAGQGERCMAVSDTNGGFVCLTANETKRRSDLGSSSHQITVEAVGSNSSISPMASSVTELKAKAHMKRRQETVDDGLHPREAETRERAAIRIQRAWRQKSRSKYLSPSSRWLEVSLHARLRVRRSRNHIPYQTENDAKINSS